MNDKELQDLATSKGFEYVRESDDHYLIAAPSEMVALLRDLLGLDVRNKDYRDYGQSINDLKEQIDGLTGSLHALYAERDALKADAERLDRLDLECEAYGFEDTHEGNRWVIDGPFRTVRDAIDALQGGDQ